MTNKEIVAYYVYEYRHRHGIEGSPDNDWRIASLFLSKTMPDALSVGEEDRVLDRWVERYFNQ